MGQGATLKKLIKNNNFRQEDFAARLGVSRNYLLVLLEKDVLKDKYIDKAAEILNVNRNVITNSAESKFKTRNSPTENTASPVANPNLMWVPLVTQRAYAGFLTGYADQEFIEVLPKIPFEVDREYRGNYVCFEVWGDSMDVDAKINFCQGEIVLCREIQRDHWRDKLHFNKWPAFVIVHDESIVIKQIIKHDERKGIITVHSLNPLYPDYDIELADVKMVFNVVKKTSSFSEQIIQYQPATPKAETRISTPYEIKDLVDIQTFGKIERYLGEDIIEASICVSNSVGEIEFINEQFTLQTGYNVRDVKGKRVGEVLQRSDADKEVVKMMSRSVKNRNYFEGEVLNYTKDGEPITCRLILAPIHIDGKEKIISLAKFSKVKSYVMAKRKSKT